MKKVLLLLANGFEAYEASVFTDVFGWNAFEGDGSIELVSVGLTKSVRCTWGFDVIPHHTLDEIDLTEFDCLAIPGGFEETDFYEDAFDERFLEVIRYFDQGNKLIASVCVAALSVGRSGVLKGRTGTTYGYGESQRQKQLKELGVEVKDQRIVQDRNIITSYSPETAIDVAFMALEQLTSKENMLEIKRRMGY